MTAPKISPRSRITMAAAMSALCLWTTGCADSNSVLFVTMTTIGIDADSRPPHATIGYDRYEGFIGPTYASGAIPPVVSKIESNLKIFEPKIRQLYATGDAARLVTRDSITQEDKKMYRDDGRPLMLFGTASNIGLRVTFAGNVPESITFGYKRKEFSYIPLGGVIDESDPKKRTEDKYGSVLASMDMGLETPSLTGTNLGISQFFATGRAADSLAKNEYIRDRFLLEAATAISAVPIELELTDSSQRLMDRAVKDEAFAQQLRDWMKAQNIDALMTEFLMGKNYEAQRLAAVAALNP